VKKVSHVSHLGQAVGLAAAGLLIAACVSPSLAAAPAASLTVRGSVKQVDVTGAGPGERLRLIDRHRHLVASRRAGSLGGVVF
jgi:hypothetical protein